MSVISVCKNVIGSNNKNKWENPKPPIRVANTTKGAYTGHGFTVAIKDKDGNIVATIVSTDDGNPVVKCGAKVAIITEYDVEILK